MYVKKIYDILLLQNVPIIFYSTLSFLFLRLDAHFYHGRRYNLTRNIFFYITNFVNVRFEYFYVGKYEFDFLHYLPDHSVLTVDSCLPF